MVGRASNSSAGEVSHGSTFAVYVAGLPFPQRTPCMIPLVFMLLVTNVDPAAATTAAKRAEPKDYTLPDLAKHPCHKEEAATTASCGSREGGFAYAAWTVTESYACWEALEDASATQVDEFINGVRDWYRHHASRSSCDKPPAPTRCVLAMCWDEFKWGVAIEPMFELGGVVGDGFGFGSDGKKTFQVSGGLAARLFGYDDKIDVRAGFAISPVEGDDDSTKAALMYSLGVGFWSGVLHVSYIMIDDIASDAKLGKGVALTADLAAFKNLAGKKP